MQQLLQSLALKELRQGSGEPVVKVLNALCDKALAVRGFAFERPAYPEDAA